MLHIADVHREIDEIKDAIARERAIQQDLRVMRHMLCELSKIGIDAFNAEPDVVKRTFEANFPNYKN